MTFDEVVAALLAACPTARLHDSALARRNRPRRAMALTYSPVTALKFRGIGPGQPPVWLYVNTRFRPPRIFCTTKPP